MRFLNKFDKKSKKRTVERKIVAVAIIVSMACYMFLGNQVKVSAVSKNFDTDKAVSCIYKFFNVYENVDNKYTASKAMGVIKKLDCIAGNKEVVYKQNSNLKVTNGATYLNTVQYMLERKEYIEKFSGIDEKEYNKKLDIKVIKEEQLNDNYKLTVDVTKTWNYSFSKNIESGAKDTYVVSMKKKTINT